MEFELRFQRDGFSIESAIIKKRALPDWFVDAPDIEPVDNFFLKAFNDLSTMRTDMNPIPWDKIIEYAEWHDVDRDFIDSFIEIIRIIDAFYLDWLAKEQQSNG